MPPTLRRLALCQAAARRELWRMFHAMDAAQLHSEAELFAYLTSEPVAAKRPRNIRTVDVWYRRLIATELRKRGAVRA